MWAVIHRELVYLWYYCDIQIRQIFWYWLAGILIGSFVSVFLKKYILQWREYQSHSSLFSDWHCSYRAVPAICSNFRHYPSVSFQYWSGFTSGGRTRSSALHLRRGNQTHESRSPEILAGYCQLHSLYCICSTVCRIEWDCCRFNSLRRGTI